MKIAFAGRMGVGKDEAVSYLIRRYGGTKISFATPLYDIMHYAQKRCGFNVEKDRKFLQYIGTDWARARDPDVWINLALKSVPNEGHCYISDLRFVNELETLKMNGWTCVKIVRGRQKERQGSGSSIHSSETNLDNISETYWSSIIYNDKTLTEFYSKLDHIMNTIITN